MSVFLLTLPLALAGDSEVQFKIGNAIMTYDNLDFRPRDESSDQAILDSDDRTTFAYLWAGARVDYRVSDAIAVNFDGSHRALWGGDQIGSADAFGGIVYVRSLYVDYAPNDDVATEDGPGEHIWRIRVGRQRTAIGGGIRRDYVLDDVSDGVRVDVPLGSVGYVQAFPLVIVNEAGDVGNSDFADLAASSGQVFNFRGNNVTTRSGATLVLDGLSEKVQVIGHFYYTDIAAKGTGADISYGGQLGNFADNDYVGNYGVRGVFDGGNLLAYGEFAGSFGVDRKELIAPDATTTGFAGSGGVQLDTSDVEAEQGGVRANATAWYSQGAAFDANGMLFSHGYVSMKGAHIGGVLSNSLMGWHPSAYTDSSGVYDDIHDRDRKTGTLAAGGGVSYVAGSGTEVGAEAWYMADAGYSAITDYGALDTVVPPYGYSREEFKAQQRLGTSLGTEVDGFAKIRVTDQLSMSAVGGVLVPGAFYKIPVARIAGNGDDTQLGPNPLGTATAWTAGVGADLAW